MRLHRPGDADEIGNMLANELPKIERLAADEAADDVSHVGVHMQKQLGDALGGRAASPGRDLSLEWQENPGWKLEPDARPRIKCRNVKP